MNSVTKQASKVTKQDRFEASKIINILEKGVMMSQFDFESDEEYVMRVNKERQELADAKVAYVAICARLGEKVMRRVHKHPIFKDVALVLSHQPVSMELDFGLRKRTKEG